MALPIPTTAHLRSRQGKARRRPSRGLEMRAQIAVIEWCDLLKPRFPELALILHVPNGGYALSARQGAQFKRMGVRSGVPDLFLPVARGGAHGLWIEMKAAGEKPTKAQREWHAWLRGQGYAVEVCDGVEEAVRVLTGYMEQAAHEAAESEAAK